MLFRRVSAHVKAQNWFAVAIEALRADPNAVAAIKMSAAGQINILALDLGSLNDLEALLPLFRKELQHL